MGSPVIANIYMEHFEELAFQTATLKPSVWLRYVDDTFVLWDHSEDIAPFLDHIKSIRPSIRFTMETEVDNKHLDNIGVPAEGNGAIIGL